MSEPTKPGNAVAKTSGADAQERLATNLLALAKTPEERAAAFTAIDRFRQSQMVREAATAIAALTWGKDVSPVARAAIARYALETGTDPVRHWEVLGNKLYDTAQLWLDVAASQPDFNGYEPEDLSWNEGLDAAETARRKGERAKHGLPQDVKGACVVRIYRKGIERPFIGANHAGNYTTFLANKGERGLKKDPIGEQDPGKTAFTRAFRRAAKTAWPIWPYKRIPNAGDEGIAIQELPVGTADRLEAKERVEGVIDQGTQALAAGPVERKDGWGAKPVVDPTAGPDPYPDDAAVRREDAKLARD